MKNAFKLIKTPTDWKNNALALQNESYDRLPVRTWKKTLSTAAAFVFVAVLGVFVYMAVMNIIVLGDSGISSEPPVQPATDPFTDTTDREQKWQFSGVMMLAFKRDGSDIAAYPLTIANGALTLIDKEFLRLENADNEGSLVENGYIYGSKLYEGSSQTIYNGDYAFYSYDDGGVKKWLLKNLTSDVIVIDSELSLKLDGDDNIDFTPAGFVYKDEALTVLGYSQSDKDIMSVDYHIVKYKIEAHTLHQTQYIYFDYGSQLYNPLLPELPSYYNTISYTDRFVYCDGQSVYSISPESGYCQYIFGKEEVYRDLPTALLYGSESYALLGLCTYQNGIYLAHVARSPLNEDGSYSDVISRYTVCYDENGVFQGGLLQTDNAISLFDSSGIEQSRVDIVYGGAIWLDCPYMDIF